MHSLFAGPLKGEHVNARIWPALNLVSYNILSSAQFVDRTGTCGVPCVEPSISPAVLTVKLSIAVMGA